MNMFKFEQDDEFFGHIVTHETTRQESLPRVLHSAHCNVCGEIELHGVTPAEIDQAYINALHTHHIQVLARRIEDNEQAERYRDGGELLGS